MKIIAVRPLLLSLAVLFGAGGRALADPTHYLDVKIEIRVLDFLVEPRGRATVAIVYDRDSPESQRQAAATLRAFEDSAALARSKMSLTLMERRALPGTEGLKALVSGPAMAGWEDDLIAYGIANHTLVLAADSDCARRRKCTVGVATLPEVEIEVSEDVVRASGIRFADGFQLMVKSY
jgi:hypothetical protein